MIDLYRTLGLTREATSAQIKDAYRRLAKEHHPDKGGDPDKFKSISKAYATLFDPVKRKRYDETGEVGDEMSPEARDHHVMLELIGQVFDKFIYEAINQNVAIYQDVPKEMSRALKEVLGNHKKMLAGGVKVRKGLEDALARITSRPEKDVIAEIISSRIGTVDNKTAELSQKIKIIESAVQHLEGYAYRVDKRPEQKADVWKTVGTGGGGMKIQILEIDEEAFEDMYDKATGKK